MVEYNYIKQINSDEVYANIISNVGVIPSFFSYDNILFSIVIKFEDELTSQQEIDLNLTIDNYIYKEDVKVFFRLLVADIDNSQYNISYVGYGHLNSCKIQKITTNATGYTSAWSEGSEVFDKIWSNRYSYNYF